MRIVVQEMDSSIQKAVIEQYGDGVREEGCLVEGPGCCRIAAVDTDSGRVAGFAALRRRVGSRHWNRRPTDSSK